MWPPTSSRTDRPLTTLDLIQPGLAALLLVCASGCGDGDAVASADAPQESATGAGDAAPEKTPHVHAPPHGGVLVDLVADSATVEVVVDAVAGKLDLYMFGPHLANYVPIEQPTVDLRLLIGADAFDVVAEAQANALTGETVGRTSHFVGKDERLIGVERMDGVIELVEMFGQAFEEKRFSWSSSQ